MVGRVKYPDCYGEREGVTGCFPPPSSPLVLCNLWKGSDHNWGSQCVVLLTRLCTLLQHLMSILEEQRIQESILKVVFSHPDLSISYNTIPWAVYLHWKNHIAFLWVRCLCWEIIISFLAYMWILVLIWKTKSLLGSKFILLCSLTLWAVPCYFQTCFSPMPEQKSLGIHLEF